jgi:hypothetical protein
MTPSGSRLLVFAGKYAEDDGAGLVWATPRSAKLEGFSVRVRHGPPTWWVPRIGTLDATTPNWRMFRVGWLRGVVELGWKRRSVTP